MQGQSEVAWQEGGRWGARKGKPYWELGHWRDQIWAQLKRGGRKRKRGHKYSIQDSVGAMGPTGKCFDDWLESWQWFTKWLYQLTPNHTAHKLYLQGHPVFLGWMGIESQKHFQHLEEYLPSQKVAVKQYLMKKSPLVICCFSFSSWDVNIFLENMITWDSNDAEIHYT